MEKPRIHGNFIYLFSSISRLRFNEDDWHELVFDNGYDIIDDDIFDDDDFDILDDFAAGAFAACSTLTGTTSLGRGIYRRLIL